MALVKICPVCGKAYKSPYPLECSLDLEDLSIVPVTEESMNIDSSIQTDNSGKQQVTQWMFVSEDGQARLIINEGDSFDVGREHTLREYLRDFTMVGRLQARLTINQDGNLTITNLGRTNKIMVDRVIVFEDQTVEVHNGSTVILGRNPDELGGYDDRKNCAFFKIEKITN